MSMTRGAPRGLCDKDPACAGGPEGACRGRLELWACIARELVDMDPRLSSSQARSAVQWELRRGHYWLRKWQLAQKRHKGMVVIKERAAYGQSANAPQHGKHGSSERKADKVHPRTRECSLMHFHRLLLKMASRSTGWRKLSGSPEDNCPQKRTMYVRRTSQWG